MTLSQRFKTHSSVWEENAKRNARWAVISDPAMIGKPWNDDLFFESGHRDVKSVLSLAESLGAKITQNKNGDALDFGCGVGRLSQALAVRFKKVISVDVSPEMIRQAKELNTHANIEFRANAKSDLSFIAAESIDFILSLIVIQHVPPPYSLHYLKEFARILKRQGTLIVQIPSRRKASLKNRIRSFVPEQFFRLKHSFTRPTQPYVVMFGIKEHDIKALFKENGLELLRLHPDTLAGEDWESFTYIVTKL
jgi:2-polyprenyl-3-methyl-5-hydroxy-6-metoxy-1,4-benzoquinol methylase